MDKLLIITEKPKKKIEEPLAISSAPSRSVDNVLYSPVVEDLKVWLSDGKNDAGFLCGSCGSGVTTLVKTVLSELDFEPYFINHSDKNFTNQLIDSNITNISVIGKKMIVVVDGLDSNSADKRILNIISDHVSKGSTNKFLCVGHYGRSMKSNEFAHKWKNFQLKTPDENTIFEELLRINAGVLSEKRVRDIARKGDLRSCINILEMEMRTQSSDAIHGSDIFVDGIDSIEFMLDTTRADFDQIYKIYEREPIMISMGVHENYIKAFHKDEIDAISVIADGFSSSDVIYEKMNRDQDWDQFYGHCAHSVCNAKMLRNRSKSKDTVKVEKFGTIWSKINNQKLNAKKLNTIAMVRAEHGLPSIDVLNLSYVREIVKKGIDGDEREFIDLCYPWKSEEILLLFRIGFDPYKHAKVKKIFERHQLR